MFVIKDINTNEYFIGYNQWNKQLRKAKIYTSYNYAVEIREDIRFIERDTKIFRVEIKELDEYNPDIEY